MSIPRPALRYHGGKFRLAPWIIRHFPPHRCYVEPYGGASSVLMQKERAYAEVYNDLDGDIVNLFRVLREPGQCARLADQLSLTPYARDEFEAAYESTDDAIERARRTIVRAEMGFGSAGATRGCTGFRIDTRRKYGTAQQVWTRLPESLSAICERLQGVTIENRLALEVISYHDAADVLFYLDPPYLHSTRNRAVRRGGRYYAHEMSTAEHLELLASATALKGMVVLSGYMSEEYTAALQGWKCVSTDARISAAGGTSLRTECLWLNPACSAELDRTSIFAGLVA